MHSITNTRGALKIGSTFFNENLNIITRDMTTTKTKREDSTARLRDFHCQNFHVTDTKLFSTFVSSDNKELIS